MASARTSRFMFASQIYTLSLWQAVTKIPAAAGEVEGGVEMRGVVQADSREGYAQSRRGMVHRPVVGVGQSGGSWRELLGA